MKQQQQQRKQQEQQQQPNKEPCLMSILRLDTDRENKMFNGSLVSPRDQIVRKNDWETP